MNAVIKVSVLVFILLNLSSCEKDFVLDEDHEPKMVVSCLLDDIRDFKVFLTKSVPTDNTNLQTINDATVMLYRNDSLMQQLPFMLNDSSDVFGSYGCNEKPQPGNKYSLRIYHAQYGEVSAEDFFPHVPPVSSYELFTYGDSSNDYEARLRLQFQDNGAEQNYYRINIWHEGVRFVVPSPGDTVFTEYEIPSRPELLTELSDTIRDYGISLLFSDRNFNGENKEIDLRFISESLRAVKHIDLHVIIAEVSKTHYDYFKTMQAYRNSSFGAEAFPVYSNINNGYGIMMSQAVYRMVIPVK